ncbi:MAG: Phage prohead protease, HK97 family [Candidatus Gottesmanbacteria bacterium GW2011_GWB1_49_7]|uniref:Phage prohead protease, HK97 family n=1 Tax=Candidatus Gottesmanbacteria bacterium GW2011_GWB1_49_7 TaxID=1618448 RepID=A0A0G1YE11_9BACT|nr:MAG: Phage prohead protease, HK97 family [Candidatus Gottesmanbacteria bacterium GW2011_GWB1_49_7]
MNKSVVPFKSYPLTPKGAWTWDSKVQNAIIKVGGWGLYKQAHAWANAESPNIKSSYKLPHHEIIGGELFTKWSGVKAAMGALLGARGGTDIPSADKQTVYNHLVKHYKEFDKTPPEFKKHILIEAVFKTLTHLADGALEVETPWGKSTVETCFMDGEVEDGSLVSVELIIPEDGSLEKSLTSTDLSTTMSFAQGESVVDEVSTTETLQGDVESELSKMRRGPKPSDNALVASAKESTDGVVVLLGRALGARHDKHRTIAFDSRMDETQREHVARSLAWDVPAARKAAGGFILDIHEDHTFAADTFYVLDPVKESVFCSEDPDPKTNAQSKDPASELDMAVKSDTKTFFVEFKKVLSVPGKDMIIRSVAYPSDRIDAHGEYASFADLEKAAHEFNIHFREINIEHTDREAPGTAVAESYMARSADAEISADKGDWCVVLRVSDEDTKSEIAAGVYKGLSIQGRCKKQPGICKGQSAVQLTGVTINKISLVENPATRLAFVAKRKESVGLRPDTEAVKKGLVMEELKKLLDLVQTATVDLGRLVKAEIPVQVPEFPFQASEGPDAAKSYMMRLQMSFLAKFLGNIKTSVENIQKQATDAGKEIETLTGQVSEKSEQLGALGELCREYERHPDIDAIRQMIIGEKAPATAGV